MKNEVYEAAASGNVEFLREVGATDIETVVAAYTSVDLLALTSHGNNIIHLAAQHGHHKFIAEALKILPASVDRIKLIRGKNTEGDTPLHMAAKLQTKEIAEHLISSYEDLCVVDDAEQEMTLLWRVHNNQGNTPLHVALMNGGKSIQVAFYLFCVGPEVAACTNHRNETPLHLAVMYDNQGAKMSTINMINKLNGQGASLTYMKNLFEEDSLSLIKFLLEENSTVCCFHDANGMTPLLRATINSYLPVVEAIISSCRESIEICDFKGRNILHHIKFSSFIKAKKFLRISGVSVLLDQQDDDGNTPVHIAAQNRDFGMIKAMIESNANFAIKNNEGISAASIIQSDSNLYNDIMKKENNNCATHDELMSKEIYSTAATNGDWGSLIQRLLQPDSENLFLSRLPDGSNIIHIAVEVFLLDFTPNFSKHCLDEPFVNEVFIVEALKKFPILSCQTNHQGQTPLHLAIVRRVMKPGNMLFTFIKQHLRYIKGQESCFPLPPWKAKDVNGNTLLHLALKYCRFDFAEYLIELDAESVREINNSKETPLHMLCQGVGYFKRSGLAAISDISHIVDLLLEKDDSSAYARDSDGFTPLLRAVHSDLLGIAMRILYHCPQSIKQYDYEGRNIFHWIKFRRNDDDRIREFLKVVPHMGVFIRSSDNNEEMPLHLAIKNNEFGTVKFLLENLDELKGWWNILDYNMRTVPDLLAITQDIPRWFQDFFSSKLFELPNELAWSAGRSLYGIHKKEIKEHMSSLGLVAALLATLTFTAAFTLPGGSNDENGAPVLANKVMFKVFMFSDLLGMCSSIMVLFCLLWFLTTSHICSSEDLLLVDMTICLLQVSFYSTLVAFMAGVYVTTYSSNPSLAISTCVLCSVIILLMRKRLVVAFMLKAFLITYFLTGMCARAITLTIKKIAKCLRLRR